MVGCLGQRSGLLLGTKVGVGSSLPVIRATTLVPERICDRKATRLPWLRPEEARRLLTEVLLLQVRSPYSRVLSFTSEKLDIRRSWSKSPSRFQCLHRRLSVPAYGVPSGTLIF